MDSKPVASVRSKMESLRLSIESEIETHIPNTDAATASFRDSLASIRAKFHETFQLQGRIGEAKAKLREADEELFKALAAKTRKEVKRMAMTDAISARKDRINELRREVQDRKDKKEEYTAILRQQFSDSEDRCIDDGKEEIEEAISWYQKVLGFHVEGGQGVRFIFKNVNPKNADEEFSFTVRLANDVYTSLNCDPHVNEIKELLDELNRTNGLFKFVRYMRQRFQEAASPGVPRVLHQEYSTISGSAPALSVSTVGSESFSKRHEQLQAQHETPDRQFKKLTPTKGTTKPQNPSPGSVFFPRRSPRFKGNK